MPFVLRDGLPYLSTNDLIGQAVNGLDATLLAAGWERSVKGQQISGVLGATDRVYFSSGEGGQEAIYIRVTQTTANDVDLRAYSFWDPGTTAGFHEAGNVAGATRITAIGAPFAAWIAADKNGVGLVFRTAVGIYRKAYFGILARQIVPQFNGQAVISNGGAGALLGQPLVKVSSTAGLTVGQDVFLVNQTAGAHAANVEQLTILAINPITSVVQMTGNLVNTYDDGALVALDPQPVVLWGSGATEVFAAGSRFMLHHASAYPGGILAPFDQDTYLEATGLGIFNPDYFTQFPVESFLLTDSTVGRKWRRGHVSRFARSVTGAGFADEEIINVGTQTFMLAQEADATFTVLKKTA